MPWYGRRTYSRYGRYYRRRRKWRTLRRLKRITSRAYATKQKMDVTWPIRVLANATEVDVTINMSQLLPSLVGWNQLSALYNSFRITFVKIELDVARQSNTQNVRQNILFSFWPAIINANKNINEVNSSNIKGYAAYGNSKSKKCLFKSTSAYSNVYGYGTALQVGQVQNITGSMEFISEMGDYISPAPAQNTAIGMARITVYIEWYGSNV